MNRWTLGTLTCCCVALQTILSMAADGEAANKKNKKAVKLQREKDLVRITIGGEPLATYHTSKDLPKPFFSPVRSEGGAIVTRGLENPEDHKHHKGVWLSIDEVNGIKYWAEQGKIVNESVEWTQSGPGEPARMSIENHWLGEDGDPLLVEKTQVAIYPNRLMSFDIRFTPASEPVTFDDTKEGLFGIRLANSLRERSGDGQVVNAEGEKGSNACWGKRCAWVDYYGPVDGEVHGAALFDHPDNPRPSRYHVRNYGLFSISPFGEKAYTRGAEEAKPVTLKPGETYRLRYGLYIHPGDTEKADVAQVYQAWVKQARD